MIVQVYAYIMGIASAKTPRMPIPQVTPCIRLFVLRPIFPVDALARSAPVRRLFPAAERTRHIGITAARSVRVTLRAAVIPM